MRDDYHAFALLRFRHGVATVHEIPTDVVEAELPAALKLIAAIRAEAKAEGREGWKEAAIAWTVCASIHREYAKGKDALFTTRQGDFVKHAETANEWLATNRPTKRED